MLSGEDYSYRKEWVRERLELLAGVFTVEVLDHAVMENHIHTILRNRPDLAKKLRKREVVERWLRLSRKSLKLNPPPKAEEVEEVLEDKRRVRELRRRLSDISWFMIMLKEPIALKANLEDDMSGHFWAERFGSVRLPNDEALLLCSLYVDLNPIRAGQADSPETSTHTGACDRLRDWQAEREAEAAAEALAEAAGVPEEESPAERLAREIAERRRKEEVLRRVLGEERGGEGEESGGGAGAGAVRAGTEMSWAWPEWEVGKGNGEKAMEGAAEGPTGGAEGSGLGAGKYGVTAGKRRVVPGVTPGTARTGRPRSGWMSPVRVEGDGYGGVEAKRRASDMGYLPMDFEKYLALLDECGRRKANGKRGVIPAELPPLAERLGLDAARWSDEAAEAALRFARIAVKCARQTAERQPRRKKK